jgi:hypothetical protein
MYSYLLCLLTWHFQNKVANGTFIPPQIMLKCKLLQMVTHFVKNETKLLLLYTKAWKNLQLFTCQGNVDFCRNMYKRVINKTI